MNSQIQIVKVRIQEASKMFKENSRMHVAGRRYLLNYSDHHVNVDQRQSLQLMDDQSETHQLEWSSNIQIRLGSKWIIRYLVTWFGNS